MDCLSSFAVLTNYCRSKVIHTNNITTFSCLLLSKNSHNQYTGIDMELMAVTLAQGLLEISLNLV